MGWTEGADLNSGDLVTVAIWNNYMGAAGSIVHLHSGGHLACESLTHQSGSVWQMGNNYLAGKILLVGFRGMVFPGNNTDLITESAVNQITFTATFKTAYLGGSDTAATDYVWALYIKDE